MGSILNDTKKILGVDEEDTAFDIDIIIHINSVFATLNQLGIGPEEGFAIEDATPTWDAFLGSDLRVNSVKTYMYLKLRMFFDPPQTSYHLEALNKQAEQLEWRLNVRRESYAWVSPTPTTPTDPVIDGGEP